MMLYALSRDQLTSEKAGLQDSLKEEYLSRQETEEKLEKANKLKSDLESQLADHALKLCYAEKSLSHLKEEMQAKVESANQGDSHDSEQIMQVQIYWSMGCPGLMNGTYS